MLLNQIIKLSAPAAFFGYVIFANFSLLQDDQAGVHFDQLTSNEFTDEVDILYRSNLPHRDVAVGWVGAARYALLNEGRDGVVSGEKGWLFSAEEFRSQDGIVFGQTLEWIADAQKQLAQMGAELVLVPLPAKIELEHPHFADQGQARSIALTYDRFAAQLSVYNIPFVETRDALRAEAEPFFKTDTHWTTSGASAVANAIAASNLIEQGAETFTHRSLGQVVFTGDLVSFVTSDQLGPRVGLAIETVSPYVMMPVAKDDGGGVIDLFGAEQAIPLNLVGTSYSANPNWSFAEAIKDAVGHDVLNFAKEGSGPIVPMRDYLRDLNPDEAPAVVIWEFPVRFLSDPDLLEGVALHQGGTDA